jgi:hypothetical protein
MLRKIKLLIVLLSNLLVLQGICGQAPSDMTDYLRQKFLKFCKSVPREEIFIHSDREEYIAGEDLWFNIYLIDRQNFRPSTNSKIVYFELLNTENRPVIQRKILIDKGSGPGQIELPDTLSSGMYTVRAYTSWMKNFLPYNCFMKEIAVFNPLSNSTFKRKAKVGIQHDKRSKNDMPGEIRNKGVTLTVKNSGPDSLEIILNSDSSFRSASENNFYIFIQTHGNINFVSSKKMTGNLTELTIPKSSLGTGINQITIFNSKCEPVAERYIYTPVKENGFLTIQSPDSCGLRDKITIEIEAGIGRSAQDLTNFSISVAPLDRDNEPLNMDDYLIFGTEYKQSWSDDITVSILNEPGPDAIDSILLNIKSNWIDWDKILSGDPMHFKYGIEKEDHILPGKLITADQQPVKSGEYLLMCTPGKEAAFQYARTDNDGNFSFNIHIDEGIKDLIIMPDDIAKHQKIIMGSSFSDQYLKSGTSADSSIASIPPYISKLSVNHQVQKIYGIHSEGAPLTPVFQQLEPLRFYGEPDIELSLADYINLPVMYEVFFELLPDVFLKKKKSSYEISITYHIGDNLISTLPSLMIDGVIIKDASMIANLDPEIVEKIDVLKEKYLVGKYIFPGIVNVITRSAEFNNVSLPDYMTRLRYIVVDPVRPFVSPDYSSPEVRENRIPDYRNTLYWNPSVRPDNNGNAIVEFWSTDNKSDYIINIQGITNEGNAFSLQKTFKVK